MPFWKQSDDPWDRKPEKRRPEPRETEEPKKTILERLDDWQEDRRAAAKEKEEAKRLPPEPCPWCGKDMEQGFIVISGKGSTQWHPGIYKYDPFRGLAIDGIDVLSEGGIWGGYYKTTWLCRDCKKMVFDMPEPQEEYDYFAPRTEEETKEEEASEE